MERLDRQILGQHRPAGGVALAEAGPVVDHGQPGAVARDKRQLRVVVGIERQNADPVGVERAGAVAFAAVDIQSLRARLQPGADIENRFTPGF